jgi:hypothetical protein
MPGPLPDGNARRRNAPTIPTTNLPAGGFTGPRPEVPDPVELRDAGLAWWTWAWRTPQAAAWDAGSHQIIARRASLEDDLVAIHLVRGLDYLELAEDDTSAAIRAAIARVSAMATGRLAITKEMRELDDRLGLTPKALAALRWKIVDDAPAAPATGGGGGRRPRRLHAVDSATA